MDAQIANRLADLRRKAGLSQEALAAKLGVSRQAVSKWERSEASPDTDNLIALASLYSVTLDQLLYGKDETSNTEQDETDATEDAATAPADDVEQDNPNEDDADAKAGEHVNIGWNGIHVSKPGEEVHVSWDGIHVDDEAKGEHVHLGRKGLHARDAAGHEVESDGAGGVTVDGTHYASWREAREARARPRQHEPVSTRLEPLPLRRVRGDRGLDAGNLNGHVAAGVAAAHDTHLSRPGPLDRPPLARAAHEAPHLDGPSRLDHSGRSSRTCNGHDKGTGLLSRRPPRRATPPRARATLARGRIASFGGTP